MSDKSFPRIRTDVKDKCGVSLMPPFKSGGGQCSQEDMDATYKIVAVRVYVERVIRKLKVHRILRNTLVPHGQTVFGMCSLGQYAATNN